MVGCMTKSNRDTDRTLLFSVTKKDLDIETFRAGGKGGQAQNKKSTGVRVRHRESGAVAEGRDERSYTQNLRNAFIRMTQTETFKNWCRVKAGQALMSEADIHKRVDKAVEPKNLRVEVKDEDGRWVEE